MTPDATDALRAWLAASAVEFSLDAATPFPAFTSTVLGSGDLVLRWYDPDPWILPLEPDIVAREVAALGVVAGIAEVPAPSLVAWSEAAPSAVLMTRLPGTTEVWPPDVGALRDLLAVLHATPPGALAGFHPYRGYYRGHDWPKPAWWRDPALWERVAAAAAAGPPPAPSVLIHRDFHPDNVLWTTGRITGVVDWANAGVGPAAMDVAHFRVNLATLHGPAVADELLPGEPAWDIEAALGFLEWGPGLDTWAGAWPAVPATQARAWLESFVARAAAALG